MAIPHKTLIDCSTGEALEPAQLNVHSFLSSTHIQVRHCLRRAILIEEQIEERLLGVSESPIGVYFEHSPRKDALEALENAQGDLHS